MVTGHSRNFRCLPFLTGRVFTFGYKMALSFTWVRPARRSGRDSVRWAIRLFPITTHSPVSRDVRMEARRPIAELTHWQISPSPRVANSLSGTRSLRQNRQKLRSHCGCENLDCLLGIARTRDRRLNMSFRLTGPTCLLLVLFCPQVNDFEFFPHLGKI